MSARSFELNKRRQGNITVEQDESCVGVELHGTVVALYDKQEGTIVLRSGGWRTTTTKTAINRALTLLGFQAQVSQKKGVWYIAGTVFQEGMTIMKVG
jgi:hypothetical protein